MHGLKWPINSTRIVEGHTIYEQWTKLARDHGSTAHPEGLRITNHLFLADIHPVLLERNRPRLDVLGRGIRPVRGADPINYDSHTAADAQDLDLIPAMQREDIFRPFASCAWPFA